MIREYKTIEEVAGPLMLVKKVDGVKYDELGEIELPDGEVRRCRVLEVNGSNVLVQLFESAAGTQPCELQGALHRSRNTAARVPRYARSRVLRDGRAD